MDFLIEFVISTMFFFSLYIFAITKIVVRKLIKIQNRESYSYIFPNNDFIGVLNNLQCRPE